MLIIKWDLVDYIKGEKKENNNKSEKIQKVRISCNLLYCVNLVSIFSKEYLKQPFDSFKKLLMKGQVCTCHKTWLTVPISDKLRLCRPMLKWGTQIG